MLPLLATRRWIGFTLLVLAAIVAFGLLSRWQWARAEEKRLEKASIEQAQAEQPVDLALADPASEAWRTVTAIGRLDEQRQVAVRQRPQDGANGLWVLAPLELADGRSVWVVRGWIPARGAATAAPSLPPVPQGQVRVSGSWHAFEEVPQAARVDLPDGVVAGVDPEVLPTPSEFDGFLIASAADSPDLAAVRSPEIDDARNISYAVQWLLFAAVAIGGWAVLLRREARQHGS